MLWADALWGVHDLAQSAQGNRALCMELDAYVQDILRVFDAEGARRLHAPAVMVHAWRNVRSPLTPCASLSCTMRQCAEDQSYQVA